VNDVKLWEYVSSRIDDMSILDRDETLWTLRRIRNHLGGRKAESILEIGNNEGAFLCMISNLLKKDGLLIGIDSGAWNTEVNMDLLQEVALDAEIHLIKGRSEEPETYAQISEVLGGTTLRILAIDSLHLELQTRFEWKIYSSFIRESPAVAYFHDIAGGFGQIDNLNRKRTTRDFWNSVKYYHSYEEKRSKAHDGPMGVGILFL